MVLERDWQLFNPLEKAKLSGGMLLSNVTGSLGVPLLPRRLSYILYNFERYRICHNGFS